MIGLMSGLITFLAMMAMERTNLDDPCAAFAIHGLSGAWGLIAVGLFAHNDHYPMEHNGFLYSGKIRIPSTEKLPLICIFRGPLPIGSSMSGSCCYRNLVLGYISSAFLGQ